MSNRFCVGFSQAAAFQALLQHGSVLQGPTFRSGLLLHWSPEGADLEQGLFLWGLSMGCGSFSPHPPLNRGLLHGCAWRSAPCGAMGCRGHAPPLHALSTRKTAPYSECFLTSFCTDFGGCSVVFLYIFLTPLSQPLFSVSLPFLISTLTKTEQSSLIGLDLAHGGSFWNQLQQDLL